jgi:hypothetical protein
VVGQRGVEVSLEMELYKRVAFTRWYRYMSTCGKAAGDGLCMIPVIGCPGVQYVGHQGSRVRQPRWMFEPP